MFFFIFFSTFFNVKFMKLNKKCQIYLGEVKNLTKLMNWKILYASCRPSDGQNYVVMCVIDFLETNKRWEFIGVVAAYVEIRWNAQYVTIDWGGENRNRWSWLEHNRNISSAWIPSNALRATSYHTMSILNSLEISDRKWLLRSCTNCSKENIE